MREIKLEDYSVKKVIEFEGMDGSGYNATLYRGSKKIAFIIDEGNGGELIVMGRGVSISRNGYCFWWSKE